MVGGISMEKHTANKFVDGAIVAAKITGTMGMTALLAGIGGAMGSRTTGAIIPRPINMWKNQRRTRSFRDALEEAGATIDFAIKVTDKDNKSKVYSLTGASWKIGCDKWELAYHLVTAGSCSYFNGTVRAEIVR